MSWQLPPKRAFEVFENISIPVADGTVLACRLWVPEGAEETPVGLVLEALPYGKRDGTRDADDAWAEQLVPFGFAYARLDLRGTGDSGGVMLDEYLPQEQSDILDVITHFAGQEWCNGSVGMRGYSWGGFNALQVAMLRPPALKAIISACSSHDRYSNDAHYVGGVPSLANLAWGAMFRNVLAHAPDPAVVGDRWRDMWISRLEATSPVVGRWLSHPARDEYWDLGSVSSDYGAIECAVYLVGGQADAYSQSIPHLLEKLAAPRKALIGPWGHHFPQLAAPGPGVDWACEEVRWWSHWLHGQDTGTMADPMLRAYINNTVPARTWPRDTPGRWIAEREWPLREGLEHTWFLNAAGLGRHPGPQGVLAVEPHQTLGIATREWLAVDPAADLPGEQSRDDHLSLVFDSDPLHAEMETLGLGTAALRLSADRPAAKAVVRICEVMPDGSSWLVAYGVLNLTHRDGDRTPTALEPGRWYDVAVSLTYAAHRFGRGSRIRVAISESLWPMLVPSPEPVTLSIMTGASSLSLPIRKPELEPAPCPLPRMARDLHAEGVPGAPDTASGVEMVEDLGRKAMRIVRDVPTASGLLAGTGTTRRGASSFALSATDDDPLTSVWRVRASAGSSRPDWNFETRCAVELRMDRSSFHVIETVEAFEGDVRIFERSLESDISRRFN